jgi:hypothetical protein
MQYNYRAYVYYWYFFIQHVHNNNNNNSEQGLIGYQMEKINTEDMKSMIFCNVNLS